MPSSLFNSVLNSTASNRKATENSCASKQPSDAELAKRKNIRKAKGGIKVYQLVSFTWSKFCHETLDGADWWVVNSNWLCSSVKLLDTSWLVHVAYAANELAALHLNGSLASTKAFRSALSEFLWNPPPVQIYYGLLYMLLVQKKYVLNTHSNVSAYVLAVASSCTCLQQQ